MLVQSMKGVYIGFGDVEQVVLMLVCACACVSSIFASLCVLVCLRV